MAENTEAGSDVQTLAVRTTNYDNGRSASLSTSGRHIDKIRVIRCTYVCPAEVF